MIDLQQLTQEQRWGLAYAALRSNEANGSTLSDSEYAEAMFRSACDSYYAQLEMYKERIAVQIVRSMPPEQREQLIQQIGVPDVLPE